MMLPLWAAEWATYSVALFYMDPVFLWGLITGWSITKWIGRECRERLLHELRVAAWNKAQAYRPDREIPFEAVRIAVSESSEYPIPHIWNYVVFKTGNMDTQIEVVEDD